MCVARHFRVSPARKMSTKDVVAYINKTLAIPPEFPYLSCVAHQTLHSQLYLHSKNFLPAMPPKRKALAEVDTNKDANAPPAKKTSKAASAKKSVEPKETAKTGSKTKKATEPKETSKPGSKTKKAAEPKETAKAASTTKKATASKGKAKAASATKEPVEPKETTNTASEIKKSAQPKAPKARKFKYSNAETV